MVSIGSTAPHVMMPTEDFPAIIGGRYRTIRVLGRGGMGVVYEVEHVHTGERLALKLLSAQSNASGETVNRFKREARASAQIKSEHVVRVTDADVADDQNGAPFLVMDLLEGADLEQVCGATPQPPALVVEWLRQVARGLDKAHRLGLVHRDLKPENIFLTHRDDGTPLIKILDFGIVKNVGQAGHTTRDGQLLGTPLYMSPEQVDGGQTPISPAADCYALGLIAYRLLTGRHYRSGDSLLQVLRDVATTVQTPSSRGANLGKDFDKWFLKACALDPRDRFPSAGEQVEALAVALGLPARTIESSGAVRASSLPGPLSSELEVAPTLTATATSVALKRQRRTLPILLTVATLGIVALVAALWLMRARFVVTASSSVSSTTAPPPASSDQPATLSTPPMSAFTPPLESSSPSAHGSTQRPPRIPFKPPAPRGSGTRGLDPLADQK